MLGNEKNLCFTAAVMLEVLSAFNFFFGSGRDFGFDRVPYDCGEGGAGRHLPLLQYHGYDLIT
ncbi:hypothetical protein J27TS7_24750 [Paenibacillus dendritiformis]|nr:hypothetical protein J27TS7_24750 [Paenibacillus dendritiformis]